jgi:radical SAM family RiPP maturation amino acid epimerase
VTIREDSEFFPLTTGDLTTVPDDYIRDVAYSKRFLERWTMDPSFQAAFEADPEAAIASLGLQLTSAQVIPLIDDEAAAELSKAIDEGNTDAYPVSVLRYRHFIQEKYDHRRLTRENGTPEDPRLAAWRQRQVNRSVGELGVSRADAIVHGPAALELSQGCTVGCWFCGVAAPKFDSWLPYTDENGELWRGVLRVLYNTIGRAAQRAFLYWATDPLDNRDYERYLVDFYRVLGRCPQTTTAQPQKDIERTRGLLKLAYSLDSCIDRFSIISLNSLNKVHESLSPQEMLRVECVPQNREASARHPKARVGRALKFAAKREKELVNEEASSTIACVSGFLFNMVERSVKLISPCNVSERWPLGYWVVDQARFDSPEQLAEALERMIAENCRVNLRADDTVRLRPDLKVTVDGNQLVFKSLGLTTTYRTPAAAAFTAQVTDGTKKVHEVAGALQASDGLAFTDTVAILNSMFRYGLFDEEPRPAGDDVHRLLPVLSAR